MAIITITGGKGGTGKSTVASALAYELSKKSRVLLVDADVDCPNDHLLLGIKRNLLDIVYQRVPVFDEEKCTKCGKCGLVCVTKAIVALKNRFPIFISGQCNGCGSCEIVCKDNAISWDKKEIGKIYAGTMKNVDYVGSLDLLSGELKVNEAVSEFIVNNLNDNIEKVRGKYDYVIVDTAAGTHCPVIAAFEKADKIIAVTEPTPLGAHDLDVILGVVKAIGKEASIIVNRADMGDMEKVQQLVKKYNAKIVMKIPYSMDVVNAYAIGQPVVISNILSVIEK